MLKPVYTCVLILIGSFAIYSQGVVLTDKERMEKGNQIIEDSRRQIGIDKLNLSINSFQLSMKSVNDPKQADMTNTKEIYVLLPDKILSVYSTTKPFEVRFTSIWNGEKYKKLSESVGPNGQRVIRDVTNNEMRGNLGDSIKNRDTLEKIKKVASADPKEKLNNDLWSEVFPLILMHPSTKAEFKYVGKAQAANREANILDTTTESGRSIRLLFDSKTNELLMMTEKYKFFDGDYENNYYYSNRELTDKVLIPKKIKVERKFTPTRKETNTTYTYIDVVDFKINPKFKSNLFDVN